MANTSNAKQTYSIGNLVNEVNKQYEGLFEIPDSELTIGTIVFLICLRLSIKKMKKCWFYLL